MLKRLLVGVLVGVLLFGFVFMPQKGNAQGGQELHILTPGENSSLTSPIKVKALVYPGEGNLVRVILVDRHNTLLARQVLRVDAPVDTAVELITELAFDIPVETTTAVLAIITQDQANRPISVRSVPVTLRSSGEALITVDDPADSWLRVDQPVPGEVISTSPVIAAGFVRPVNDRPVIIEMVNVNGYVLMTRQLVEAVPGEGIAFTIALPYGAGSAPRDVRLVIRQASGFAGVDAILDSLTLILAP